MIIECNDVCGGCHKLAHITDSLKITQTKIFKAKTCFGQCKIEKLRQVLVKWAGRLKKPKAIKKLKRFNGC